MMGRYTLQSQYLYVRNHEKWLSPECKAIGGGLQPNAAVANMPQCSFDFGSTTEGLLVLLLGVIGQHHGHPHTHTHTHTPAPTFSLTPCRLQRVQVDELPERHGAVQRRQVPDLGQQPQGHSRHVRPPLQ